MTFVFVHTADWQIGKAFARFPPDTGSALRDARLAAIDRLAEAARAAGAQHMLVAGDVYDTEVPSTLTLRQPLARMHRHDDLVWHLLPGNHDPHRPGGLWERVLTGEAPANVRLCLRAEPVEVEPGVVLLPAPLTVKATAVDPTAWMEHAATPDGSLRIGLAHGPVKTFGGEGGDGAPIATARADSAALGYLALGDWHGCREIGPRCWYSGTPEPDRFVDNDPGHALVVRIDGPRALPVVTRVETGHFRWVRHAAAINGHADLETLGAAVLTGIAQPHRLLVKATISGSLPLGDIAAVNRTLDRLESAVRHLDRDLDGLSLRAGQEPFADLGSGDLGDVAQRLQAMLASDGDADRRRVEGALARLLVLASEAGVTDTP